MEQAYVLRLYDTDLLSFSLSEQGIEGLKAQIHSIDEEDRALFPLDLELTDDGLVKWLQRRVIPKNRAYVAEILKTYGLSVNDTKGIIDVCKGLSLNDSYWVVPQGFTGTFAQYNLYENRFSEILSLVAYTGIGQSDAAFTTSPELTTNGMLPKAWRPGGTAGAPARAWPQVGHARGHDPAQVARGRDPAPGQGHPRPAGQSAPVFALRRPFGHRSL